tara:strand:+ start:79 stop:414 length:336 start_codon:yes stop_codon:yes gene_type:complete
MLYSIEGLADSKPRSYIAHQDSPAHIRPVTGDDQWYEILATVGDLTELPTIGGDAIDWDMPRDPALPKVGYFMVARKVDANLERIPLTDTDSEHIPPEILLTGIIRSTPWN